MLAWWCLASLAASTTWPTRHHGRCGLCYGLGGEEAHGCSESRGFRVQGFRAQRVGAWMLSKHRVPGFRPCLVFKQCYGTAWLVCWPCQNFLVRWLAQDLALFTGVSRSVFSELCEAIIRLRLLCVQGWLRRPRNIFYILVVSCRGSVFWKKASNSRFDCRTPSFPPPN